MATSAKSSELYIQWLNDAYSMELALVPVLENHAKDLETQGQDSARIRQHITETQRHADVLKECITRAGGSVSALKAGLGKAIGAVQSVSTGAFPDELIKNALADFAAEHFEIACYTSLIAAAEAQSDTQTATACRSILQDEISMAEYLKAQIPLITTQMLNQA
jgi:ferritin-like metal-binding protein YciE